MAKVLIIDDDRATVILLQSALSRYQTVYASDGVGALHQVAAEHPDLVMLDLRMPGMDGALLLPKIREISTVPVIVLSARHEQADVVQALEAGADDFVSKPFELDDLEARVEAVLRRSTVVELPDTNGIYTAGALEISDSRLATVGGHELYLTPIQHKLLMVLARYVDQLVTREQLYDAAWSTDDPTLLRTLRTHMGVLGRRLRQSPGAPTIVTVRQRGWMLRTQGGTS